MTKIKKRNGEFVDFDSSKISKAITRAMRETEKGVDETLANDIAKDINDKVYEPTWIVGDVTVEIIQDMVEEYLMDSDRKDVAKQYILYRNERAKLREQSWEMNDLQRDVVNNKYRHNNESFNSFIKRVSGGNKDIAKLIRNRDFLFGGRILAGRGIDRNVSLANCTTLPPIEDNIESIFDSAKQLARMFSYGQGAGIDLSQLRPEGAKVNNASKTSTGAVSFARVFDNVSDVIGAEGRRAALLIAMDANHKDILDFINMKNDIDKINNANISVKVDDNFMKQDTKMKRKVLHEIAKGSWATGEPAILNWDNNKKWHLLSHDEDYVLAGVNACSEYPTIAYGTCVLGSINLSNYVLNPFTKNADIDIERLAKDVKTVTIAMDEVVDETIPSHPLQAQRDVGTNYRSIGIGIMGLADMFIKLGLEYGKEQSLQVVELIGKTLRDNAYETSVLLAKEKGAFPKFSYSKVKNSPYFKSLPQHIKDGIKEYGIRNNSLLSIAPTGTLSLLCGVSGGLEPIFATSFTRTTKSLNDEGDKDYKVYTKVISDLMDYYGLDDERDLPDYCVTAHDLDPFERIELQSRLQHYVDLAISSTINLNEDATVEDIEEIYKQAHKKGLKGVSIFRNNCFRVGILNTDKPKRDKLDRIDELKEELDALANEQLKENPDKCPMCGGELKHSGGCSECLDCGYSPCSI